MELTGLLLYKHLSQTEIFNVFKIYSYYINMSYQSLTNSLYAGSSLSSIILSDTTQSTSKDTGALVVDGGAGIEKDVFIGGALNVTGAITGNVTGDVTGTADDSNALNSSTTAVSTSSATAPTSGQVLTATSSTTATWQTPSTGGSVGTIGWGANLVNASGGSIASSGTIAGADLRFFRLDVSGNIANGGSPGGGTYRNQTGMTIPGTNSGYFKRES